MAAIGALLVVAVVTVITAGLLGRQAGHYRLVQAEQTRTQSRWLLQGGVAWAQQVLRREALASPLTRLDGAWRSPVVRLPMGGDKGQEAAGFFTGEITDEAGKFNLRNIEWNGLLVPAEVSAFNRLCALLGIGADVAGRIMNRVAVSLPDINGQGAIQRSRLLSGDQATKDRLLAAEAAVGLVSGLPENAQAPSLQSIDDLLAVAGVDLQVLARLRPYVTILPQRTWINANTAQEQVVVARVPELSMESAKSLLATRDRGQWFVNQGDIVNRMQIPEVPAHSIHLGIQSNWFLLRGAVQRDGSLSLVTALLFDDKKSLPRVAWLREGV